MATLQIDNLKTTGIDNPDADGRLIAQKGLSYTSIDRKRCIKVTRMGWFLSFGIHIAGYCAAALMFAWLGIAGTPRRDLIPIPPIHASLGDELRIDDLPALQIIPASGPETDETIQSMQQLASSFAMAERGQLDSVVADAKIASIGNSDSDSGNQGETPFFRIPEGGLAVTRGSFTAWTDPANPETGELYQIIIEIRLPDETKRYKVSDLSGTVKGTDGHRQRLPFDRRYFLSSRVTGGAEPEIVTKRTIVDVTGRKLQLAIKVPGARVRYIDGRPVQDTIRIKSRKLREEQELVLVFGGNQNPAGLELGDE
ncbi:MAG: hypothetical protein MK102_09980 [Fuerstiella sp.]|nr:hypothetical protein [Fuerstiella sp.]